MNLADAIRRSLANVQTVKANVAVQTTTLARFEALKEFVPLVNLPQWMFAYRRFTGGPDQLIDFPDVTGLTGIVGKPGLDFSSITRVNYFFPLDPSGQITTLPIAEEGIRAKLLMEQMIRRSQAMLAIQGYFEAKQVIYGVRVAQLGVGFAEENLQVYERKRWQRQAFAVEVLQAQVNAGKARVLLAGLERVARISQRNLAVVLHRSRLLVPQDVGPIPIDTDEAYDFDLGNPDMVDLAAVPDFPASRAEAIQLAKRQRAEVRLLVVGLRIARLQQKRWHLQLFGAGRLPSELSFKNGIPGPRGAALGAVFGASYAAPILDVGLWANIRRARLDVVQSQLDLEKALLDVSADAGNSWDRWQQAQIEWQQQENELILSRQLLERQERLYQQKQSIWLEVLGARLHLLQADANRWSAWMNLQLATLNVLRATEQLLDYFQRAGIADVTEGQQPPPDGLWRRWVPWLSRANY